MFTILCLLIFVEMKAEHKRGVTSTSLHFRRARVSFYIKIFDSTKMRLILFTYLNVNPFVGYRIPGSVCFLSSEFVIKSKLNENSQTWNSLPYFHVLHKTDFPLIQ
jgi:hypothetical protein